MRRSGSSCYLDSSALVKLVVAERESRALGRHLAERAVHTSALARVEVVRAVRPHGPGAVQRAWAVLDRLDLLAVSPDVLDDAAMMDPSSLRSLDAIHLASALLSRADELVTYDRRMAEAGQTVGLVPVTPA